MDPETLKLLEELRQCLHDTCVERYFVSKTTLDQNIDANIYKLGLMKLKYFCIAIIECRENP